MGKCIVDHCTNKSESSNKDNFTNVSFFRFPTNVEYKLHWVKAIKKADWAPTKCSRICSNHFEEKFVIVRRNGSRTLTTKAIPTLNLPETISMSKETQTWEDQINFLTPSASHSSFYPDISPTKSSTTLNLLGNEGNEDSDILQEKKIKSEEVQIKRESSDSESLDITFPTNGSTTLRSYYSDMSPTKFSTTLNLSGNDEGNGIPQEKKIKVEELQIKQESSDSESLDNTFTTNRSTTLESYSDISPTEYSKALSKKCYEDLYMKISDGDTPQETKLKYEIKRLSYVCKKRKSRIACLNQNNRRSKKKIEELKDIIDKLRGEKLLNSDECHG